MAFNGALTKRKEHILHRSLGKSRVNGNHKIKMASICYECGSLLKLQLKQLGISTSELKIH